MSEILRKQKSEPQKLIRLTKKT